MIKHLNTLFLNYVNKETLANLTMEVKETLATGFGLPHPKTFTAADVWNIQRRRKNIVQRRLFFKCESEAAKTG